jgi:hypothetical protein
MAAGYVTLTSGDKVTTTLLGGEHTQKAKLVYGDDTANTLVTAGAPLPVVQTGALPAGTANIGDVDVASLPAGTMNNGTEVAVPTSATLVMSANTSRKTAVIQNVDDGYVRVGASGVAASGAGSGFRLGPGEVVGRGVASAIYAIAESGTQTLFAMGIT